VIEEILRSLGVERLRTVVDRAETGPVWRVDVGAVGGEEADCVKDHFGFVGVNFAGAEGEVQHTVAFVVGCLKVNAWCFEELFEEIYLTFLTC
jgi:hypothetical protein